MKKPIIVIVLVAIAVLAANSLFILDQRKQALVLQLGKIVDVRQDPGLHFKLPFVQNVVYYDMRLLSISMESEEVIAFDRKRLLVDAFAKFKIIDPLKYYQSVRTDRGLDSKFGPVLESSIRKEIGKVNLIDLLSEKRTKVMQAIKDEANKDAGNYGIDIVDVRIMRTDLPQENSNAIYERMKTQHEKEARQTRAQGSEESTKIKANAKKEQRVLLAEATKQAEILRGEGDGIATKIFADAFSRDGDFYKFYRTMQAYRASMLDKGTRLILSPDNEFMHFFNNIDGSPK